MRCLVRCRYRSKARQLRVLCCLLTKHKPALVIRAVQSVLQESIGAIGVRHGAARRALPASYQRTKDCDLERRRRPLRSAASLSGTISTWPAYCRVLLRRSPRYPSRVTAAAADLNRSVRITLESGLETAGATAKGDARHQLRHLRLFHLFQTEMLRPTAHTDITVPKSGTPPV